MADGGSLTAGPTSVVRTRLRGELGKGVQALRKESLEFSHSVTGALTFTKCMGPWETDIDVKEIWVTAGIVPTANNSTLGDIFNGTVAGAVAMVAQFDPDALTLQVPSSLPVLSSRVNKGDVISVRVAFAGDDGTTPANLTVRIGYDIPVYDLNAAIHTYGAYDDGE